MFLIQQKIKKKLKIIFMSTFLYKVYISCAENITPRKLECWVYRLLDLSKGNRLVM
jgi:hypothetical protein